MGDFEIKIRACGGHGCDRGAREGNVLKPCGSPGCPDCFARFVARTAQALFSTPGGSGPRATFTHWPGQDGEVVDDLSDPSMPRRLRNDFYNTRAGHVKAELEAKARRAYDAYVACAGGLNFQGNPCPKWDELPAQIKNNWAAAVLAIAG